MKKRKYLLLLLIPLFIGIVTAITMWLWNAILPQVLEVNTISYWEALGLLILARILFGGFGCGGRKKPPFGPRRNLQKKWRQMNEEEKQKFKEEWRNRYGGCRW